MSSKYITIIMFLILFFTLSVKSQYKSYEVLIEQTKGTKGYKFFDLITKKPITGYVSNLLNGYSYEFINQGKLYASIQNTSNGIILLYNNGDSTIQIDTMFTTTKIQKTDIVKNIQIQNLYFGYDLSVELISSDSLVNYINLIKKNKDDLYKTNLIFKNDTISVFKEYNSNNENFETFNFFYKNLKRFSLTQNLYIKQSWFIEYDRNGKSKLVIPYFNNLKNGFQFNILEDGKIIKSYFENGVLIGDN